MGYDDDIPSDESLFLWLIKTHLITGRSWFVIVSNIIAEKTTVKQNKDNNVDTCTPLKENTHSFHNRRTKQNVIRQRRPTGKYVGHMIS